MKPVAKNILTSTFVSKQKIPLAARSIIKNPRFIRLRIRNGDLVQLVERMFCTHEATGSSPVVSKSVLNGVWIRLVYPVSSTSQVLHTVQSQVSLVGHSYPLEICFDYTEWCVNGIEGNIRWRQKQPLR